MKSLLHSLNDLFLLFLNHQPQPCSYEHELRQALESLRDQNTVPGDTTIQRDKLLQLLRSEGEPFKERDMIKHLATFYGLEEEVEGSGGSYNLPSELQIDSFVQKLIGN